MRKSLQKTFLELSGKKIPAKIYFESRNNVRASIGKQSVILRVPRYISKVEYEKQFKWFLSWVEQQFHGNQELHTRFFGKGYQNGDQIHVGSRTYTIHISRTNRKTHGARLKNRNIHLMLSQNDSETHLQKAVKHLLSRVIGKDFLPEIQRRVLELNQIHFQQNIRSVQLKYNHTNWGSCSSMGNVNLSTRLLFAPEDVIDYVIIHELAHLIELNHSQRFWRLVQNAMPNYKEKEAWLNENNHLCHF